MADPTLKDVLKVLAEVRRDMATKADVAKLDAKVEAHRAETRKGFDDLDKELAGHASVHREIEKDIEALKRRAPRTAARAPRRPRAR